MAAVYGNLACLAARDDSYGSWVVLGLGCNMVGGTADKGTSCSDPLAGKIALIQQAVANIDTIAGVAVQEVSSFYTSEPAYYADQDEFVNAVALVRCTLSPHQLLDALHVVENELGRVRTIANGPRTCDIDIEDFEGVVSSDARLTLPHPRILERDFVVKPLLELRPHYVLADGTPVTNRHVKYGAAQRISAPEA